LLYGGYTLAGVGSFTTEVPADLRMESTLPVMDAARVGVAMKKFAEYRRNQPGPDPGTPGETPTPQTPQIVRLDTPDGPIIPGLRTEIAVATPIPFAGAATPRKTRIEVAALPATPRPVALPTPMPGVLKPFLASNPEPGLPGAQGATWRIYKPGALPAGRVLSPVEAGSLDGPPPAQTFLRGSFFVTARDKSRASLRPRPGTAGAGTDPVRIIVEYANGMVPPAEGGNVDRDETAAYEIRDVRKGEKGELNIWVREIVEQ
ncbi:MAG: hypothetical protein ABIZ56_01420, partial [Chthoniobacteraceae bacterium]